MAWWPVDGLSESYWWGVWSSQYINLLLNASLNGLLGGVRNCVVWPVSKIMPWKAFLPHPPPPPLLASWATGLSRSMFTPLYPCGMVLSCHDLNDMWTGKQELKTETVRQNKPCLPDVGLGISSSWPEASFIKTKAKKQISPSSYL